MPGLVTVLDVAKLCETSMMKVGIAEHIGVGAGKFLGVRRIFDRISPNLPEKCMCAFFPQIFSHEEHEDLFLM